MRRKLFLVKNPPMYGARSGKLFNLPPRILSVGVCGEKQKSMVDMLATQEEIRSREIVCVRSVRA
jgi:hypothetical protein